jgi:tetratricopeptide (TPR) repeat protein
MLLSLCVLLSGMPVAAQSVDQLMQNGQEMLQRGAYSQAVNSFRRVLSMEPDYFEAQFNLGFTYVQWGKNSEAVVELKKALSFQPRNSEVWSSLAVAYDNLRKSADAQAALAKAVEYDPENVTARMNLGAMYANSGKHQQAISLFKQVVAIDGSNGEALLNLARSLVATNAITDAAQYFRRASAAMPDKGDAHAELGMLYWKKHNDLDKAIGEFRAAIAVEGNTAGFYEDLASALEAKGEKQEAVATLKQSLLYIDDSMKKEKVQERIGRLEKSQESAASSSGSGSTISKDQTKEMERALRGDEKKRETRTLETIPVDVTTDLDDVGADSSGKWDPKAEAKKRAQEKKGLEQ